ncbi:MAG: type IV pilus modification protein PilV [Pseudomonadota bacterium]
MKIHCKNQSGFTLIEVLIALVIMAIGLLGIATLQIVGLKNNHSAYLRTQATTLANEYADLLRANSNQKNTFVADGVSFMTSTSSYSVVTSCNNSTGCSASEMAETDVANWVRHVQTLPEGNAIASRAGSIFTLRVFWLDDRNDNDKIGIDIDGDGSIDSGYEKFKVFVTSFQP